MFGPYRRFPFRGLALVALGFLLASVLAGGGPALSGAAAGVGFLLVIPLIMLKMLFMFFLFGVMLRFVGGGRGRGPWGPGPYGGRHHDRWNRWSDQSREHGWGQGWGPGWGNRWGSDGPGSRRPPSQPDDRWSEQEQRDWEESLRLAKEELRDSERRTYPNRPYPGQGSEGFEPPTPRSDD